MNKRLNITPDDHHDVEWWRKNIKSFEPWEMTMVGGEKMPTHDTSVDARLDERIRTANAAILRGPLMRAGLNAAQTSIVAYEGLSGLYRIMVGGTGHATPVKREVFLEVVNILYGKEDDYVTSQKDQGNALPT